MRSPLLRTVYRGWKAVGLLLNERAGRRRGQQPRGSGGGGLAEVAGGTGGAADGADALRLVLRSWQAAEAHPHAAPLVRAPRHGVERPDARALLEPLPPPAPPPSWRRMPADRAKGVQETVAVRALLAAPLQARVGALVQLLRRAGGVDGIPLPPLPPSETALLAAAEAHVDVETARQWRKVAIELRRKVFVEYDVVRLNERRHAGARASTAWAAQEHIYAMAMADDANHEVGMYQKVVAQTNSNPMMVPLGEARLRGMGNKKSLEQRRRGALAMRAMLERNKLKYVPDKQELREARLTQQALNAPSRLEARAAAWIYDASGKDMNKAAATLQAAQRGETRQAMAGERAATRAGDPRGTVHVAKNREQGAAIRDSSASYRMAHELSAATSARSTSSKLPIGGGPGGGGARRGTSPRRAAEHGEVAHHGAEPQHEEEHDGDESVCALCCAEVGFLHRTLFIEMRASARACESSR